MVVIDDTFAAGSSLELLRPFGQRHITHAIHDIDGTHSLIRDWPPVMSLSMHYAMTCGLADDFDDDRHLRGLIGRVGAEPLPETDNYCIECSGFSALTQLEYAIRRAVQLGNVPAYIQQVMTPADHTRNAAMLQRILSGHEHTDDPREPQGLRDFIAERGPRLFRLYEKILNGAGRDRNTADAWVHPERWRVPGSLEFLTHLHDIGVINYFVTGAVIYDEGGMREEIDAVGIPVGPGQVVEALRGSSWDKKMPKDEWMRQIFKDEHINPDTVLVVGDGRTEIKAGVELGCVTISRLRKEDHRQREIQSALGVHMIVTDYTDPALYNMVHTAAPNSHPAS
jgi:phosphoglycolate phosphatase-like HAD superfamily hydrolase